MGRRAYAELNLADIDVELFDGFNRYQKISKCWVKNADKWELKDKEYVENWGIDNIAQLVKDIKECLKEGGKVWGAFTSGGKEYGKLVGFFTLEGERYGNKKEYAYLSSIYVSFEYRGFNIGKELFDIACEEAKKMGAKKLYIYGHPSKETQAFYDAVGCKEAKEIITQISGDNPVDKQLEFKL